MWALNKTYAPSITNGNAVAMVFIKLNAIIIIIIINMYKAHRRLKTSRVGQKIKRAKRKNKKNKRQAPKLKVQHLSGMNVKRMLRATTLRNSKQKGIQPSVLI